MAGVPEPTFSRRAVLRAGALGAGAVAVGGLLSPVMPEANVTEGAPLARGSYAMNADWLFGGVYATGAELPGYSERGFGRVTLPHTVTPLSWSEWDASTWERRWIYRKHISSTTVSRGRVFVDFQGVMTTATVWCNGQLLATHEGGYLPFSVELTPHLVAGDNVLAVRVDATLQDIPPNHVSHGVSATDFFQPGGIYRDVTLRITPEVYVADVFAKPVDVLTSPGLEVEVTLDCGRTEAPVTVVAALMRGSTTIAQGTSEVAAVQGRYAQTALSLTGLEGISLWSPESPTLYDVRVTATHGPARHTFTTRTGFREATFQTDGFYLNGERYQIFGLSRHQLFPFTGMAAPRRLHRRDAEILKNELSCNMVRCSHYPQSGYFLDACDELGLLVWEETPGWQYVGDSRFQQVVLQNVRDMVVRDRSRPSVIVWGTRLNESPNKPALYARTGQIAADLDGTRQTTGAMDIYSTTNWNQQVFAFDDYQSVGGHHQDATLRPPLPGVPYMVSEAVGALDGAPLYRWIDSQATLALQAKMHAQVHSLAGSDPGYAGLLGWCGMDFQSPNGGRRIWRRVKTPGVTDMFRVPKPSAGLYASQASEGPMIAPAFFWDFGPASPPAGPGEGAMVFTNCEQLNFYVGDVTTPTVTGTPDTATFPNLAHAPVVVDFPPVDGTISPPLRIDGLIAGSVVTSLQMSADTAQDALALTLDDPTIVADGSDATRVTLRIVDAYGNHRPLSAGSDLRATFSVSGPGTFVGDSPFPIGFYGGVAGGFVRSERDRVGTVTVSAACPGYAARSVTVQTHRGESPVAPLGSGGARVLTAPPSAAAPPAPTLAVDPGRGGGRGGALDARIRGELRRLLSARGLGMRISRLLRGGDELMFRAPVRGTLVVGLYHETAIHEREPRRARRLLVASADAHIHRRGRARVHVRVTDGGRTLLRHARSARLRAVVRFTPVGHPGLELTREITVRR